MRTAGCQQLEGTTAMRVHTRSSKSSHFSAVWETCRTWTQESISGSAAAELRVTQSHMELRQPRTYR